MIVGSTLFTSLGNGGAETCDGPIVNGTIVNENDTVIGVVQNFDIFINNNMVNGTIVNGTAVVDENDMPIGTVTNTIFLGVKCDC